MTRQNKKKAGIIISLCAVLAAGQTVLAAGSGSGSNVPSVLYVGGAAAVMDHYFGQDTEEKTSASAGTSAAASSETKAQQEKTAFVRTSAQVPVAGVADLYETSAAAETIPETSSVPETLVVRSRDDICSRRTDGGFDRKSDRISDGRECSCVCTGSNRCFTGEDSGGAGLGSQRSGYGRL